MQENVRECFHIRKIRELFLPRTIPIIWYDMTINKNHVVAIGVISQVQAYVKFHLSSTVR